MSKLIAGSFQPLTRLTVEKARQILEAGETLSVLVMPHDRGPETPFSFGEIKAMWEGAFPANVIEIALANDGYDPCDTECAKEEMVARNALASTRPFWVCGIPHSVSKTIETFDGQWKQSLGHSWV